jgi:hypothetical protein
VPLVTRRLLELRCTQFRKAGSKAARCPTVN